ncbi:MAG: zinc finger domain-containing protein [Candidatus Woesearchaeota archaeon]
MMQCTTSKQPLTNDKGATSFLCPQCGDYELFRSRKARETCMKYTCPSCGFTGPN